MAGPTPKTDIRCPHCAGPLSKEMETSAWTVPPLIRDSFSMVLFLRLPTAYILIIIFSYTEIRTTDYHGTDWLCCRWYIKCFLWIQLW